VRNEGVGQTKIKNPGSPASKLREETTFQNRGADNLLQWKRGRDSGVKPFRVAFKQEKKASLGAGLYKKRSFQQALTQQRLGQKKT